MFVISEGLKRYGLHGDGRREEGRSLSGVSDRYGVQDQPHLIGFNC